ncbi:MAG TPA: TPM domain-containing protein, partial [Pyrinomonadaceae bacterium]|nr:TPM domain-containing protein [Pyrinomonadaceae bacterium]
MTKISLAKKSKPIVAVLAVFFAVFAARAQEAQPWSINTSPLPAPTGFVNDHAGVIDAATKERLEAKLKNFKETTNPSVELAVAVVRTTGDRPIFDYSLAVARGWGIGSKEDDSPSALLFVAIEDRKYFTQISRDLED